MAEQKATEYVPMEQIGRGSFGLIRKVKRKSDGIILCRKEINYFSMSEKERQQLYAEFSILHSLKHSNIVRYYDKEHIRDSKDLHLYMEYCSGGDLGKTIKELKQQKAHATEDYVWNIFSQIITALYRCHYGVDPPEADTNGTVHKPQGLRSKSQVMILHRDLKPENIFLGDNLQVKLGDFGLSKVMQSHDFASTYVGTPYYMSPEICANERYTLASDIWALGCIMYELCTRNVPFNATTQFQLVQKIKDGKLEPMPSQYSPELQEVIKSCLRVNPTHRPETSRLLSHPLVRLQKEKRGKLESIELKFDCPYVADTMLKAQAVKAEYYKKLEELNAERALFEAAKAKHLADIEESKRREWEVKARLEITRQVNIETEKLRQMFDKEVENRIRDRVTQSGESKTASLPSPPLSQPQQQPSFALYSDDEVLSSTEDSKISNESTVAEGVGETKMGTTPPQRRPRAPFSRSRTQIDSPMDITMAEPSPMSIAGLSLSPRRTAGANAPIIPNSKNIFAAAAAQKSRLQHQLPTPSSSTDQPIIDEEEEEEEDNDPVPELPSPTRAPVVSDPFKAQTRPGLIRQKTAPMNRFPHQPSLFPTGRPPRGPSPPNPVRPVIPTAHTTTAAGSPTRKAATGTENEMFKKIMNRNLNGRGRTLVELEQARAGGIPLGAGALAKGTAGGENNWRPVPNLEPPVWDPETDEMPSPFLRRGSRKI